MSTPIGRYKVAWISLDLMAELFTTGFKSTYHIINGIPEDANLISGCYDPVYHRFGIICEHPTWPEISDYELIRETNPIAIYPEVGIVVGLVDEEDDSYKKASAA